MSVLSGWGVSGPRFDTIQDWASLANVKPPGPTRMRRSASTGYLPSASPSTLSASSSTASLGSPAPLHSPQTAGGGRHRAASSAAFGNNPYQISRGGVSAAVAASMSGLGSGASMLSPGSPSHAFAIHQLPRSGSTPVQQRAASASAHRHSSPIAIPSGSPLPLSPTSGPMAGPGSLNRSESRGRLTLVQQQSLAARPQSLSMSAADGSPLSPGFNPYLLADTALPARGGEAAAGAGSHFRKTKNLEQRLAEYLRPPRTSSGTLATQQTPASPTSPTLGPRTSPGSGGATAGGNISVNVLLHPKNPLGSLSSPTGAAFGTGAVAANQEVLARASAAAAARGGEESKDSAAAVPTSPLGPRARKALEARQAAEEEARAAAQAAELMKSVKKGKKNRSAAEEAEAAAALQAAASAQALAQEKAAAALAAEDSSSDSHHNSAAPASMNLKAILRERKAQEALVKQAAARESESKKPWAGLSWGEVLAAKMTLIAQAKSRAAAASAASAGASPTAASAAQSEKDKEDRAKQSQSQAFQVASLLLAAQNTKPSAKKPFNIYSLNEFQRSEYKYAVEQGKWLAMVGKEEASRVAGKDASSVSLDYIPNEQKRVSSKTRCMNMAKGDVVQQSGSNAGGGGGGAGPKEPPQQQLLLNTYVTCNGQYGYVRFVGRVAWGSGVWVGMELVEKHPYTAAKAPWVDFHSEHSAISMAMIEESAEQKAEQKKKIKASMQGSVADQMAAAAEGGPQSQMMLNTSIPRPLIMAAMLPPAKEKSKGPSANSEPLSPAAKREEESKSNSVLQPLSSSIFPFIDVVCFLREGLAACFDMGDVSPELAYFAPLDSVKRVAQRAKIDSKTILQHKEAQTNPFAPVDELAMATPKKQEATVEMLARYLTVSDREVLDGERNKARAIFRWICHNIRFDPVGHSGSAGGAGAVVASSNTSNPSSGGAPATDVIAIIRHRRATSEGFALLFHALATAAGLQCLRIRGVEKQLNPRTDQVLRNRHCWNAIKVEGEWSFIDCVYSCGQFVEPSKSSQGAPNASASPMGEFRTQFSDAYFCTPPSLFILEHFPSDAFGDSFSKLLPQEYNNLQLLRSSVSAGEFEKGLIPGRAFVEYQMRAQPWTYAIECKQPSYQIELTAPAFILFDVDLRLKSHVVDLSQCSTVQYDGEQVTIFLIFPVPGEYVCRITCKPSWRELDVYDACLTYRLTSHTGLVPLAANKDVIIGYLQHRKVNARDSRSLFNRHFTLLHPLSGHLLPKSPFLVQIKGPDIADSVIVACNGDWQRLGTSTVAKSSTASNSGGPGGVKVFEGTCVIQPRYELQIFYEMNKTFHLLFFYKANLTSFSNVYLSTDNKEKSMSSAAAAQREALLHPELWHGKCSLGIEGRVFDANLSLDVPACKFGRSVCTFLLHVSTAWDLSLQVQDAWKNGAPLADNQVVVEELKNFRTQAMTQYKVTTTLPQARGGGAGGAASNNDAPPGRVRGLSVAQNGDAQAAAQAVAAAAAAGAPARSSPPGPQGMSGGEISSRPRGMSAARLPLRSSAGNGGDDDDSPRVSTQFVLVINARNSKQGGPMRYAMSYFWDTAKIGSQPAAVNQNQMQIEVE